MAEASTATNDLRYPIGKAEMQDNLSPAQRRELVEQIAQAPARLRAALEGLTPKQIETPYREGGWTVRQVTHHLAESHMNAYIRFKLALTEDNPTINAYDENAWAQMPENFISTAETSLALMESLHERWVNLLRTMSDADFSRTLQHPERGQLSLDKMLSLYSWHGRHHVAHITSLRQRQGWS